MRLAPECVAPAKSRAMVRVRFEWDDGKLRRNLADLPERVEREVRLAVDRAGMYGMASLKMDAPWTDRTGAARAGLYTKTSHSGSTHEILFSHTVHYGIWLEVKFNGRDQVIVPTMRKTGARLMSDMRGILGRI